MMLPIEQTLEASSRSLGEPLIDRYNVLKHDLLEDGGTSEYWAAGFRFGNNHGPSHIKRVLEHLDQLLGPDPTRIINPYELYLTMMSVLYHDVGILGGRSRHADRSGEFLYQKEEDNRYIFDSRDREIIRAAVVSHSSSKDIDDECSVFQEAEIIRNHIVRPRTVAALVRFADELDEDHRRADPLIEKRIGVGEESRFYWRFCQRILGIKADRDRLIININIKFEPDDCCAVAIVDGETRRV
jgi:hypothetical protein